MIAVFVIAKFEITICDHKIRIKIVLMERRSRITAAESGSRDEDE